MTNPQATQILWETLYYGSSDWATCYDLAKQLSHYLYLLYFTFLFGLTTQESMWESVMSQVSQSHDKKSQHHIT